jgi:hypothetical protein
MPLPRVQAVRYLTSLREGGSLPALVEASNGKLYVAKMRGAGQGPPVLAAEVIVGEMARALGLRVPEISLIELDPQFAKNEPDQEIQDLMKASAGLNMGLEFLPEAAIFDPAAGDPVSAREASLLVWLDAFTMNVDRTPRNANLLLWQGEVWLIDHGASLFFHFDWPGAEAKAASSFAYIKEHVLLRNADELPWAAAKAHEVLTPELLQRIVAQVPDEFLQHGGSAMTPAEWREGYVRFFTARLRQASVFEEEMVRAHSL